MCFFIKTDFFCPIQIKAIMKRSSILIICSVLYFMIGGCSFYKGAVDQSMEINKSVGTGDLQSMFLNVVRASKHMPPVITALSEIQVSAPSIEGSGSLEFPFGVDSENAFKLTPSLTSKYGLSYKVNVLQTQEFMRGFLSPIDPHLFKYFWDMGWRKTLLLNLFVREIKYFEITYAKDKENVVERIRPDSVKLIKKYVNYPMDQKKRSDFNDEVNKMVYDDELEILYYEHYEKDAAADTSCSTPDGGDGAGEAKRKGRKIARGKDNASVMNEIVFFEFTGGSNCFPDTAKNSEEGAKECCSYACKENFFLTFPPEVKDKAVRDRIGLGDRIAVIYLRSPEAVLYYLGEVVRAQNRDGDKRYTPRIKVPDPEKKGKYKNEAIFLAGPSSTCDSCKALLSVKLNGEKWIIPDVNHEENLSFEVLSLLSQLIGLRKNEKDMPVTPTLRVIP